MKLFVSLLLIAALYGCTALDPGQPTYAALQARQAGLDDGAIPWPTAQWWLRYQDSQLNQLISQALVGSPSLGAAQARVNIANAAVTGARAIQLPQLNASYNLVRERFSENYIFPPPYGGSMQTDNSLQLELGLDLDLWGRNRARYAAAVSEHDAVIADLQVARNSLISSVIQSYFNLQNALAQKAVITRIVKQLENVARITRQRVRAGLDTEVEVDQADSAVSAARVQLSQADTNAGLLRNQIAVLTGSGPDRSANIDQANLSNAPDGAPTSIPFALLGRRPDIVAAKHRVQASSSQISAAKAEFFPNINLSAFAGFMSLGLSNLLQSGSQVYGVGPAITLPIFSGGALNASLRSRQAERDLAIADYNETLLSAVREVADATIAIKALQQQTVDQAASLRAITSAYNIAVQRYKSGLGNFVQVLLAQNEVQKQAILNTDMRVRAFNLNARLATALGGGYGEAFHTQ
ncbi:efflux transporter outer membrane subunit [Candidimonas sp. SYP-B2681]|uniref:efflux transporter outer membrane subunit n=1 Tax=Candidimonas sp. SYP-B2681 TaxID=2497686 RepID=UPI000F8711FE|nr:efflux transporter outer membrane subunit [Candidimonas sp. SYP-B2681]RTZ45524.1 efflux transporter outer membrane subunit [Candidimonas sp. SYP-B2681]